jgi:hypothetical protein
MIPQDQEFSHAPEEGIYGDCFRAVLASLLELPIAEVPHFLHDNCNNDIFNKRLTDFLKPLGFVYMSVPAFDMEVWKKGQGIDFPIYHEISDESPRFPSVFHSVVGCDGIVVHDGHPTKMGLPKTTEGRIFSFLVKIC